MKPLDKVDKDEKNSTIEKSPTAKDASLENASAVEEKQEEQETKEIPQYFLPGWGKNMHHTSISRFQR